ncbi:hypothetical protein Scep_029753 [Stephania cephalantha]|uniref:Uncharacterized protein n=1 Tax=Stephania cephalantha TaxID=152367 RepID=A0AAP0E2U1_9MAGN
MHSPKKKKQHNKQHNENAQTKRKGLQTLFHQHTQLTRRREAAMEGSRTNDAEVRRGVVRTAARSSAAGQRGDRHKGDREQAAATRRGGALTAALARTTAVERTANRQRAMERTPARQ